MYVQALIFPVAENTLPFYVEKKSDKASTFHCLNWL